MLDRIEWRGGIVAPSGRMTNLKNMKRAFLALIIGLIASAPAFAQDGMNPLIPGGNSAPPGHAPKAVVSDPLYDFGSALEGTMVTHTFAIKNNGQGYLDIQGVKTSCGCTTGNPSKMHVAPGDESDIAVSFDTHFQKGHQVRTITVSTNDPDNPQVAMTMQGIVKKQVEAVPGEISFGDVKRGTEDTKELLVNDLNPARGAFSVGPVSNSNSSIKVEQEKRPDGKPGALLKVSLLKTMPVGPFDDTIKITNNRVPLQVDVFGTVTGDLNIDPAQVSFGIVPRGQDIVQNFQAEQPGTASDKGARGRQQQPGGRRDRGTGHAREGIQGDGHAQAWHSRRATAREPDDQDRRPRPGDAERAVLRDRRAVQDLIEVGRAPISRCFAARAVPIFK